jgi:predicted O-methyltransferase YrrM
MLEINEDLRRRFSQYVNDLFAPEDDVLAAIARRADELGLAPMEITAEVGKLLHVLALAIGARRVLEVGTFLGYSAIWMARALPPDGRLITIEADPKHAAEARDWLRRAGLGGLAEVWLGRALDVLPTLAGEAPFDLAFLDAAKAEYPAYLDWALRLVRPGGIITADNTLFSGSIDHTILDEAAPEPGVRAMREFNRRIATDPGLASILVPVREGVTITLVRESSPKATRLDRNA